MRNLYADLAMFKRRFANNATLDTSDATEIERASEAASRRVDDVCRRHFFAKTETRYFAGNGHGEMRIPDLLSATSIKLDEDGDRTFELTLAAGTDYYLERAHYENIDALPKTLLRLDAFNGQRSVFACQPRLIEIVGRWGFTEATEDAGTTLAEELDTTEPGVDVVAGTAIEVGQTLLIEDEQMYVQANAANTVTVERGVNGTTKATHATGLAIARFIYVPNVREAAIILAGRAWKRRDTSYANTIANPVVGSFEVFRQTDPDCAELLWPFVRWEV